MHSYFIFLAVLWLIINGVLVTIIEIFKINRPEDKKGVLKFITNYRWLYSLIPMILFILDVNKTLVTLSLTLSILLDIPAAFYFFGKEKTV